MTTRIAINNLYELTEIWPSDEQRLLEIAQQPNFLCAPLNGRLDAAGRKVPLSQCAKDFIVGSVFAGNDNALSDGRVLAVREKMHARRLMGAIGITGIRQSEAELGYFLAPEIHGQKIIMPAIYSALKHASDCWNVQCLRAEVDPQNIISLHILRKLGFKEDGPSALSKKYCTLSGAPAMRQHMLVNAETLRKILSDVKLP